MNQDQLYYDTADEIIRSAETIRDFGKLTPIEMEKVWQETAFKLKGVAEVAINDSNASYGVASNIHKMREEIMKAR